MKKALSIMICASFLMSCVSTYQIRKTEQDDQNNSTLIIHRKGLLNILSSVKIYLNDKFVGQVGPGRYLKMAIPSGSYIIKAKGLSNTTYYNLNAKGNKTYLISLRHKTKLANQVDMKVESSVNIDISKIKKPEIKVTDQ